MSNVQCVDASRDKEWRWKCDGFFHTIQTDDMVLLSACPHCTDPPTMNQPAIDELIEEFGVP